MEYIIADAVKETIEKRGLKIDDIKAWEAEYGQIPAGAFVAFRSDWHKKANLDNPHENGVPH